MRVSTTTVFEQGIFNIQRAQAQLVKQQEQISTGRRVLSPADDPVAAARALEVTQSKEITEQYARNGDAATAAIGLEENALARYTALLQDVRTLTVNAGDGALTPTDLKSIATELRARYTELIGIANSTDGNGLYLFSGYQGSTQPFTENAPGVVAYNGDQGQRLIQIGATRQVAISDAGSDVFQRIRTGNGVFATTATTTNTGGGIVSEGVVRNRAAWDAATNPQNFEVRFFVDNTAVPPQTTYDIVDTVNNLSLTTGAAPAAGPYLRTYQSGGTISFARQAPPDINATAFDYGIEMSVTGQPASGDTFTIAPSANQDIFATLDQLITAIETGGGGMTANTALANALNTALNNFDNAIDVSLTVTASVGARAKEIQTGQANADDLTLQYETTLSGLTNLDYAKAISELTFNQVSLEAAQQSFVRIQGLSLFNFL
ncbi:MAG: flagellar hook-associated protein FlgL [Burkholderiales bacterium]|nr:flagellar hook-associated protein FlgL [Burkholderiales bacterium]